MLPDPAFSISAEDLRILLEPKTPPCISIYLPTHRRKTEGRPDQILFRNLCREAEKILKRDMPGSSARDLVSRLSAFDCEEFWDEGPRSDGLAIFVSDGFTRCYKLPAEFPALNVVGGTFHTKPVIRFLQANSLAYRILAINAQRVALYEGHGDSIQEIPVPEGVRALEAAEAAEAVAARGSNDRLHFGQGGMKDQVKIDLEKHFRNVVRELWKGALRASETPLILAAPAQQQTLFRKVAQIPTLLDAGIVADPSKLGPEALRSEARRILDPELGKRIAQVRDEFALAQSRKLGSDTLKAVAGAVVAGRVKTLLVESGRRIWGLLDTRSGDVLPGDSSRNAHDVDLLDELAEQTLVKGGSVYVVKKDDMPTTTGLAAVFRF